MKQKTDKTELERRLIKKLIVKAKKRSKRREREIFLNAGLMGVFGWHITVPVILATFLGVWLKKSFDMNGFIVVISMLCGFFVGGYNTYRWTKKNMVIKPNKDLNHEEQFKNQGEVK